MLLQIAGFFARPGRSALLRARILSEAISQRDARKRGNDDRDQGPESFAAASRAPAWFALPRSPVVVPSPSAVQFTPRSVPERHGPTARALALSRSRALARRRAATWSLASSRLSLWPACATCPGAPPAAARRGGRAGGTGPGWTSLRSHGSRGAPW